MFHWIPKAAEQMRGELVEVYWGLLLVVVPVVIILEFLKVAEGKIDPFDVIKRTAVSVLLLWSFKDVINLAGDTTQMLIDKMGGTASLDALLEAMGKNHEARAPSLFKYREMFIYFFDLFCYAVGVFGYFVVEILSKFIYTVLYVLSPLLILAYVPRRTAHITSNLYGGIFTLCVWKVLWFLLGTLFYKFSTVTQGEGWDGVLMGALMNLCIGLSMLMVPVFANSLLGSGLSDTATRAASGATAPLAGWITRTPGRLIGATKREMFSGFPKTRQFSADVSKRAKKMKKRWRARRDEAAYEALKKRADRPKRKGGLA